MQTELDSADLSVCSTGAWFDPGCSVYVIMSRKMFWSCLSLFSFFSSPPIVFPSWPSPATTPQTRVYLSTIGHPTGKATEKDTDKDADKATDKDTDKTMVKALQCSLRRFFGRLVYSCP